MCPKVVLSPFPLRPLYPSLWLAAATPRLYKKYHHRPSRARACSPITDPTISEKREPHNPVLLKCLHSWLPPPPLPPFGLMDRPPTKPLDSPRQSRRRGTTPSISETPHPSQPAPVSGSTSTPLPSIRHLHPHLPPPNQYFGPSDPSAYPPSSFEHPPQSSPVRYQTQSAHQDPTKELLTIEESDSDKHSSPPPKKRRKRQALSCTGQ